MKRLLLLVIILASALMSQTSRPASSKALSSYQWSLTTLTACASSACYPQAGGANDTADMYLGAVLGQNTNSGVASAGFINVGTSITTVAFLDGNGVTWATSVFPASVSGTTVYPLGALMGVYFAKGLSITCSGGCSTSSAQIYYQR